MNRVSYLLRSVGRERGDSNEDGVARVLDKIAEAPPPWFKGWAKATREQDLKGIDFTVQTTDMGDLYLQVKSSHAGCRKFESRRRKQLIAVVLANNPTLLPERVQESLNFLRSEIQKMRGST